MSFFESRSLPVLTCMINGCATKDQVLRSISRGLAEGAQAFGLQMEQLEPVHRTETALREIFAAMDGRPAYVTNYRRTDITPERTDEERAQGLLLALECGASLLDVHADIFAPHPLEITEDPQAVEKQIALINAIHAQGGEVLLSSHLLKYLPPSEILRIARLHESRGADVSKIVASADDAAQLRDQFRASLLLSKSLSCKFLYLCNGSQNRLHRRHAPVLGDALFLCTPNEENGPTFSQPPISLAKQLLEISDFEA